MKKLKERMQGIVIGVLIGSLLTASIVVVLARTDNLNAFFNDIRIVVDGREVMPTDAQGNRVEPFIVDGTTFLPVRAVANALGMAVYWDGPNWTVYLGNMGGRLERPTTRLENATNISRYRLTNPVRLTDNYGNQYAVAVQTQGGSTNEPIFQTLLNMRYSYFRGAFFVAEGSNHGGTASFRVEVDGRVVYNSPELDRTSRPVQFDINVTGGNDFRIYTSGTINLRAFFGDAGFHQ